MMTRSEKKNVFVLFRWIDLVECGCSNFAGVDISGVGEMIAMTFLMFFGGQLLRKIL